MSITRTIGKNTLGDNNKMKVNMRTYNRSTHDLSYIWRNTQAVGTLVPFMCEVALPGDTHEIKLEANVMTHPTVGPLFGSFKLQMDVFSCPIRLYNAKLHNNALGIGLDIKSVKLPQLALTLKTIDNPSSGEDWKQINPSCILSYLGLRGWGICSSDTSVNKNATPFIAYWDIFKNYYANKQEKFAYFIATVTDIISVDYLNEAGARHQLFTDAMKVNCGVLQNWTMVVKVPVGNQTYPFRFELYNGLTGESSIVVGTEIATVNTATAGEARYKFTVSMPYTIVRSVLSEDKTVALKQFQITSIDEMRDSILRSVSGQVSYEAFRSSPFIDVLQRDGSGLLKTRNKQFGLAVKTYNSDIMQNWINTEWIDGANGINAVTAVSTDSGSFSIDALNLASKVYDMLNRIALSGGSYSDWIETVFTNEFHMNTETPVYEGGASQEIVFQEVVSNAATASEPLGSLAGRGKLSGKQRGGFIKVRTKEPSYIMGIVSITPRLDYSQGNRFDTLFETLDDLHKPALDGIGFQDLITDKLAWWSTKIVGGNEVFKSVGKQPAWLDYMTNYNRTFGSFADNKDEAFMVLNRNYEMAGSSGNLSIKDITTYIDPAKFNYIFADTRLDAMNYWVQIAVDMKARRMISAKTIPNL